MVSSTTSDKEIGQIPSALRVAGATALLLCCSSSPMPYIDSSSRLESEPFRPQQMACYSWDRTLVRKVTTTSAAVRSAGRAAAAASLLGTSSWRPRWTPPEG